MQFYRSNLIAQSHALLWNTLLTPPPSLLLYVRMGLSDQTSEMCSAFGFFHKCPGTQFVSPPCGYSQMPKLKGQIRRQWYNSVQVFCNGPLLRNTLKMLENQVNQTKLYSKNSVYCDRKGWSLLMAH